MALTVPYRQLAGLNNAFSSPCDVPTFHMSVILTNFWERIRDVVRLV